MYLKNFIFILLTIGLLISAGVSAQTLKFNHYRVHTFRGRPAAVKLKGNPLATMYKTRITEVYKAERLNFAGHYCLVWWGCGSDCQHAAVVDLQTGKVYDGPTAANLFEYKAGSRLLIVNPPTHKEGCPLCRPEKPEYWLWNDRKKVFTMLK